MVSNQFNKPKTRDIGQYYEQQACRFLKRQGLQLIEQNYYGRQGEIDLIMQDQQIIVFVEVRYRSRSEQVHPFETITPKKQLAIQRTAMQFLQQSIWQHHQPRFDVIAMTDSSTKHTLPQILRPKVNIEWLPNAF